MSEKEEQKMQHLYYERKKIKLYYPTLIRKGKCEACKRTVQNREIKTTQRHHTVYAYELKTVLKNPVLALDNSLELCFGCHPIADGLREVLLSNPRGALRSTNRIFQVLQLLPQEQQDHFTLVCRLWLKKRNGK